MKKSKRLLSIFLAALMLVTCFGAVQASALTQEEAEQAAIDWNAACPDLSDAYANMSAKQAESTMKSLDAALALVLEQQNIAASIYNNANMTKLFILAASMDVNNDRHIWSLFADNYEGLGFPQIAEVLRGATSITDLNTDALDWQIEPGDSQAFKYALFPMLFSMDIAPNMSLLTFFMYFYEIVIIPIMESFHTGNVLDFETLFNPLLIPPATPEGMAAAINQIADSMLDPIIAAIDRFLAHPILYLCEILPDICYTYEQFHTLIGEGLPSLNDLAATLLATVGESTGITFPEMDLVRVAHMGTAKAEASMAPPTQDDSYLQIGQTIHGSRVGMESNQPMVFATIVNYAGELLRDKNNQAAIGRLITEQVGPEYLEDYDRVVAAATGGSNLAFAQSVLDFADHVASDLSKSEEASGIVAFFAKIVAFFTGIFKKILDFFSSLS